MIENQRVSLTKRLLKEALIRLLERKEISHISITELCAEAGINRTTFYRHYDLPRSILDDIQKDLIREMREEIEHTGVGRDMDDYIRVVCRYLHSRKDIVGLFVKSNVFIDYAGLTDMLYSALLARRDSSTALSSISLEDLKMLASFLTGGGYSMVRQWFADDDLRTSEEMADAAISFLKLYGHISV